MATPIGNLADLSPRAREVLASVDCVLAEDTRRIRKLLNHFAISTTARSLHEHNEARELPHLLARLRHGAALALVSDAGTPLLADPGYRLVRACREEGIAVFAVPGPSAVAAALSVAGVPPYPYTFVGFLPVHPGPRRRTLRDIASLTHTAVIFLSPHRLARELSACVDAFGGAREAALLAELTKLHERCLRGTLTEVAAAADSAPAAGEYTLVVGPALVSRTPQVTPALARQALDKAIANGLPLTEARRVAAHALGISRRDLYRLLMDATHQRETTR